MPDRRKCVPCCQQEQSATRPPSLTSVGATSAASASLAQRKGISSPYCSIRHAPWLTHFICIAHLLYLHRASTSSASCIFFIYIVHLPDYPSSYNHVPARNYRVRTNPLSFQAHPALLDVLVRWRWHFSSLILSLAIGHASDLFLPIIIWEP
jgi:hypothetical protein